MLSELFTKFGGLYLNLIAQPFHSTLSTEILKTEIPSLIQKLASIPPSYKVYASYGSGQWAEIPWIAILDKTITESTTTGFYIVYLFSADMKTVSLSLGLGWTQFEEEYGVKEGRYKIEQTVEELRKILRSPLDDFSFTQLDLSAQHTLGKGYESGVICHKKYLLDSMPDDNVLVNDLRNLMGVYRELRGLVGADIFNIKLPEKEELDLGEFSRRVAKESAETTTPEEAKRKIAELSQVIEHAPAEKRSKMATYVERDRKLAELVKQAANYACEVCGAPPFKQRNGKWYAEAHHTLELAVHRIDRPDIMICICPTCHKVVTYGTDEEIERRKKLKIASSSNP